MTDPEKAPQGWIAKAVTLTTVSTVVVAAVAAALIYATEIFLILGLAVLFGVFLTRTSGALASKTPLPYGGALAIVTSTLLLLFFGGLALFGVQVDNQVSEASKHLDEAQAKIQELAKDHPSLGAVLRSTPILRDLVSGKQSGDAESSPRAAERSLTSQLRSVEQGMLKDTAMKAFDIVMGLFKTTFGLLLNSVLIFFVGLFVAISPASYRDGIVVLFPPDRRKRTREVLDRMGDALWNWLIGRFGSMLVTGVGAGGLMLVMGVPMAISLGIATALLTFIPNIGGVIALLLAILFALPQGSGAVITIIIGYLVLQLVESYVVTPLIQRHQVALPPALLIAFQAVFGVLFGFLGAAIASPLLAAAKVGVEEAYISDVLEAQGSDSAT